MAENVYSEQFGPELVEGSLPVVSLSNRRSVEPILYYGDNYEHRTGKTIHKRGPLGFPGYNRWTMKNC